MNLSATLSIAGRPINMGGTSEWSEIQDKPFETLSDDFTVDEGELKLSSVPVAEVEWSDVNNKPFTSIDTESGLTVQDDTLMIDTLDTIATIDYVDQQIDGVTTTLDDYALKSEIPTVPSDISAFNNDAGYITDSALAGYATESYVDTAIGNIPDPDWNDIQNKPTFATVAYSGDYDDLLNKPVIPAATEVTVTQGLTTGITVGSIDVNGLTTVLYAPTPTVVGITNTLSTGTAIADIDVDGVTTTLYAPAGGSVDIDNKSIIENGDGELQTAANLYYEDITNTYNAIKGWSGSAVDQNATNSDYAKAIYADSSVISDNTHYYDVIVNFVPKNETNAITVKGNINYIKTNTNNVANGDLSDYFSTIRVDQNGGHAWSSTAKVGSINWIIFPTIPYKSGYETDDVDYTERVYNQLSVGYIPVDDTIKYVDDKLHIFNDILTKGVVGSYSVDVQTNYNISGYPLKPVRLSVKHNQTIAESSTDTTGMNIVTGGELGLPMLKSSNNLSFTRSTPTNVVTMAENALTNAQNQYRWIGIGYVPQSFTSGYNNNSYNSWIYGRLWCGDISSDRSDFIIEGLEAVLDSWVFDTAQNKYILTFKSTIYPKAIVYWYYSGTAERSNPEYQKMNSFFLPLDNSTIVRDSDGNIKTAIPAPPTTDGTYTLQAVVSNGEPTYSWI